MTLIFSYIWLCMFVIDLGVAFGATVYEQRIVLPQWFSRSSENGCRVDESKPSGQTQGGTQPVQTHP